LKIKLPAKAKSNIIINAVSTPLKAIHFTSLCSIFLVKLVNNGIIPKGVTIVKRNVKARNPN